MSTGDSNDILNRVKQVLPKRWFQWIAPYRDALLGAIADRAAWCFSWIGYARSQTRISTAYGIWLDIIAFDFLGPFLPRNGAKDTAYRALIQGTILQERVTRKGMIQIVTNLSGQPPFVFEPWNTGDTGAYSSPLPGGFKCGQFGYGVGIGGYGSMQLPAQTFMKIFRSVSAGIPLVEGYGDPVGGYGAGAVEYTGGATPLNGVTDAMILDAINKTKPTGSIVWTQFPATTAELQQTPEWIWPGWF